MIKLSQILLPFCALNIRIRREIASPYYPTKMRVVSSFVDKGVSHFILKSQRYKRLQIIE